MGEQVGEPDRIGDVGLAAGHVLDVGGVGQDQGAGAGVEHPPDRAPVDAAGLHGDVGVAVLVEPGGEVEQGRRGGREYAYLTPNLAVLGQADRLRRRCPRGRRGRRAGREPPSRSPRCRAVGAGSREIKYKNS